MERIAHRWRNGNHKPAISSGFMDDYRRILGSSKLVAVTLLIAESKPAEKEIIVRIVTHLLCEREGGTSA